MGVQPVLEAVRSAVDRLGTPAILNSDQGSQFTSNEYKQLLKGLHIRQSMDGKSRWADNIMIERWFRSLKTELIYVNEFRSPRELRQSIRSYIDDYNRLRPHEALDYATPDAVRLRKFSRSLTAGLDRTRPACCSPQRRGCDGVRIHSCPPRAGQYNRPVTSRQGNLLTQAAGAAKLKTSWLGHGQSQNVFTIISSRVVLTRGPL